jgi:hypothetical protein
MHSPVFLRSWYRSSIKQATLAYNALIELQYGFDHEDQYQLLQTLHNLETEFLIQGKYFWSEDLKQAVCIIVLPLMDVGDGPALSEWYGMTSYSSYANMGCTYGPCKESEWRKMVIDEVTPTLRDASTQTRLREYCIAIYCLYLSEATIIIAISHSAHNNNCTIIAIFPQ